MLAAFLCSGEVAITKRIDEQGRLFLGIWVAILGVHVLPQRPSPSLGPESLMHIGSCYLGTGELGCYLFRREFDVSYTGSRLCSNAIT